MISMVGQGSFRIDTLDGRTLFLEVDGGFAEVCDNVLTILAERTGKLLERSAQTRERVLSQAKHDLET